MISFNIPYPPTKKGKSAFCRAYGLNAYYSGKHWTQREKDAEELHRLARLAMKKAGIRRQAVASPVEVRFYWDDGLDADNHAVMGKAFLDAMVQYILPDDNRKWVQKVSHEFWDGGEIRVEVRTIRSVKNARRHNMEEICETCRWYAEFEGVCCNDKSPYRGGWPDNPEGGCDKWEDMQNGT